MNKVNEEWGEKIVGNDSYIFIIRYASSLDLQKENLSIFVLMKINFSLDDELI